MNAKHLEDRVDSIDPGVYYAHADEGGYQSLTAAVAIGAASVAGECFLEDGRRSIVVRVGGAKGRVSTNPEKIGMKFKIDERFYTRALQDYNPWRVMWWREAIQNARDGDKKGHGAKRVVCDVAQEADGTWRISVQDDGPGMDASTIENKFLALGGTGAEAGATESYGGFGEAKRLLVVPWMKYEIRTRDLLVVGHNMSDPDATGGHPFVPGVKLTVWMPDSDHTGIAEAIEVIENSYLPGITFYCNGTRIAADLEPGQEMEGYGIEKGGAPIGQVYKAKRVTSQHPQRGFLVRQRGLFTFKVPTYLAPEKFGRFAFEVLEHDATKVFNTNRMSFNSDHPEGDALGKLLHRTLSDLLTEPEKTMRSTRRKNTGVEEYFKGTGGYKVAAEGELQAILQQHLEPGLDTLSGNDLSNVQKLIAEAEARREEREQEEARKREELDKAREANREPPPKHEEPPPKQHTYTPPAELITDMIPEGCKRDVVVTHLAHDPDFRILKEDESGLDILENFKVPAKLRPGHMTKELLGLARFWAYTVASVLARLGERDSKYGIGWTFNIMYGDTGDPGIAMATCSMGLKYDLKWVMLNPYKGGNLGGDFWDISDIKQCKELWFLAVHECTHYHNGISKHGVAFASAFGFNSAVCAVDTIVLKRISLAARKRAEVAWKEQPKVRGEKLKAVKFTDHYFEKDLKDLYRELGKSDNARSSFYDPKENRSHSYWVYWSNVRVVWTVGRVTGDEVTSPEGLTRDEGRKWVVLWVRNDLAKLVPELVVPEESLEQKKAEKALAKDAMQVRIEHAQQALVEAYDKIMSSLRSKGEFPTTTVSIIPDTVYMTFEGYYRIHPDATYWKIEYHTEIRVNALRQDVRTFDAMYRASYSGEGRLVDDLKVSVEDDSIPEFENKVALPFYQWMLDVAEKYVKEYEVARKRIYS